VISLLLVKIIVLVKDIVYNKMEIVYVTVMMVLLGINASINALLVKGIKMELVLAIVEVDIIKILLLIYVFNVLGLVQVDIVTKMGVWIVHKVNIMIVVAV